MALYFSMIDGEEDGGLEENKSGSLGLGCFLHECE